MALNDFAVRQAQATAKDYTLNDTDGLALFVIRLRQCFSAGVISRR